MASLWAIATTRLGGVASLERSDVKAREVRAFTHLGSATPAGRRAKVRGADTPET